MKVNWKVIGKLALGIVEIAVPQVGVAEAAFTGIFQSGADKKAKVREAVVAGILAAEDIVDRELVNEVEVQASIDGVIDAIVHVQNTIASVKAAKGLPVEDAGAGAGA